MKQLPERRFQLLRPVMLALLTALCLLLVHASPAYSQTNIDLIEVVNVDYASFPDVTVQARVVGANLLPVEILAPDAVIVTENGIEQSYEHQSINAGAQIAIVADLGAGSDATGASGGARHSEVLQAASRYIDGMGSLDSAMFILHDEDGLNLVQEMTGDRDLLREAVSTIAPNYGTTTNGLAGVRLALEELEAITGESKGQAVLYLTTGVQNSISPNYEEIQTLAAQFKIPVYVILANQSESLYRDKLSELAASTGGLYAHFRGEADLATNEVFEALERMRTQYTFTFHSRNGTGAERTIVLQARGGGPNAPQDYGNYTVELTAPRVAFDLPLPGSEIRREANAFDQNLDEVEPTSMSISAHVEWDDGYPRNIASAQLYIDNEEHGAPILELGPDAALLFPWDLRPYRTPGENVVQIQVRVVDELGIGVTELSSPLLATVLVSIPPEPEEDPQAPQVCDVNMGLIGYVRCVVLGGSGLFSLIIAIPTLILAIIAWRNKDQIAATTGKVSEAVTEFVARVTRPADAGRQASAYLTVLRGDPYLLGKKFPIFANTITPIGRDKSQVEIVFPDEDNSVISRKHCEIRQEDGTFKLRDFASTYGTFLNGVKLPELGVEILHHDDEISLGPVERGGILLRFETAITDEDLPNDLRETQPVS